MMKKIKIVTSHLGDTRSHPGNSTAGVHAAWSKLVTPEADLRMTRDGEVIFMHDDSINQTCLAPYLKIKEHAYKELSKHNLCSGDGVHHPIPRLLDIAQEMTVDINRKILLDIKDQECLPTCIDIIRKFNIEKQVYFSCASESHSDKIKRSLPKSMTFLLVREVTIKPIPSADAIVYCGFNGLLNDSLKNPKKYLLPLSNACKKEGKLFGVVTLENISKSLLQEYIDIGVSIIGIEDIDHFKKISQQ